MEKIGAIRPGVTRPEHGAAKNASVRAVVTTTELDTLAQDPAKRLADAAALAISNSVNKKPS